MLLISFFILPAVLSPKTAHAGLFSFISELTSDKASAKTIDLPSPVTSQNMALLQAAVNTDPNPHKSDSYIPRAYGNALVAEIGPQGTVSEVNENIFKFKTLLKEMGITLQDVGKQEEAVNESRKKTLQTLDLVAKFTEAGRRVETSFLTRGIERDVSNIGVKASQQGGIDVARVRGASQAEIDSKTIENAFKNKKVKSILAHTLGEENASTHVLKKCGF